MMVFIKDVSSASLTNIMLQTFMIDAYLTVYFCDARFET